MEITMETPKEHKGIAYQKAQKRVKEIKMYYYMVLGFFFVGGLLIYRDYEGNIFDLGKSYQLWMVSTWAIFLILYGIYLFSPFFRKWEDQKIKELMKHYNQNQ